ncbi:MAG: alpha-ketoglutarate-dependent dioxygenase AlkB [Chloroflexota bacterium]|nr:alpha-ketoglutarate-dependent dioxygenase AlkB [Chloroflexota bacterium]
MSTDRGLQASFFDMGNDVSDQPAEDHDLKNLTGIGAIYEPGFLTEAECEHLLNAIDAQEEHWMTGLQRRVQHFGWKYDYSSRGTGERADPVPDFILPIAEKLRERGWFSSVPDQVIINEYEPGQGIGAHADRDCFGPAVAMLSLADRWPMQFEPAGRHTSKGERLELFLDVGSILVLTGEVRNKWVHSIVRRKTDGQGPAKRKRERRVSVTFRTIND